MNSAALVALGDPREGTMTGNLVALRLVDWEANAFRHVEVTCANHTGARYLTKGPGRHLHFIESHWTDADGLPDVEAITSAKESGEAANWVGECSCPAADLRAVWTTDLPLVRP